MSLLIQDGIFYCLFENSQKYVERRIMIERKITKEACICIIWLIKEVYSYIVNQFIDLSYTMYTRNMIEDEYFI